MAITPINIHMQKNEVGTLTPIIYKKDFQMD